MPELLKLVAEAPVTAVDNQESNQVYMTVTMRMLSTAPNGNKHVVQKDFIAEIIENQSWYIGTPVKADTSRLQLGYTDRLGHKFNPVRKEYMTEQIGSILSFEAAEEDGETVLYGTARIDKTHQEICETIVEMYNEGSLCFSFEISAAKVSRQGEYVYIGADPDNRLTAMCVVSIPAYSEAKAIKLVASMDAEFMNKISTLTDWVAELEVDGVRQQLYRLLFEGPDRLMQDWSWEIREFGVDYALLKNSMTGERVMIKYHVENDVVMIDEKFEVEVVKKEEPLMAEEATPETTDQTEQNTEPVSAEDASAAEPVEASDASAAEAEEIPAEAETSEPTAETVDAEMQALTDELNTLREFKAQIERDRIAAELTAKQDKLRAKVVDLGLDPLTLSAEITALDYEAVFNALSASKTEPVVEDATVVNLVAENATALKGGSKWADYVKDATGL